MQRRSSKREARGHKLSRGGLSSVVLLALLGWAAPSAAQTELRNDGFEDLQQVGFQAGFVAGEMGASRFDTPDGAPMQLVRVRFLFGGAAAQQTLTLHVWDDTAGTPAPGAELFSAGYMVTPSDTAMQEIDLSATPVTVPGTFRVGLEFDHSGLPSIARDTDGNITPNRNFIFAQGLGWAPSGQFGLTGDWILRAVVDTATPPDAGAMPDAGAPPDAAAAADAASSPDAAGTPDAAAPAADGSAAGTGGAGTGAGGAGGDGGDGDDGAAGDSGGCDVAATARGALPAGGLGLLVLLALAFVRRR